MFSIIETVATVILLLLLMMFVLHVIRGDAADWLTSKFRVMDGMTGAAPTASRPKYDENGDPLFYASKTGQVS